MTPTEIQANRTQGELWIDDDGFIACNTGDNYQTIADCDINDLDIDEREANKELIVSAVNNTYGKGYDPSEMDNLYKTLLLTLDALKDIVRQLPTDETLADYRLDYAELAQEKAAQALNAAKL